MRLKVLVVEKQHHITGLCQPAMSHVGKIFLEREDLNYKI